MVMIPVLNGASVLSLAHDRLQRSDPPRSNHRLSRASGRHRAKEADVPLNEHVITRCRRAVFLRAVHIEKTELMRDVTI